MTFVLLAIHVEVLSRRRFLMSDDGVWLLGKILSGVMAVDMDVFYRWYKQLGLQASETEFGPGRWDVGDRK